MTVRTMMNWLAKIPESCNWLWLKLGLPASNFFNFLFESDDFVIPDSEHRKSSLNDRLLHFVWHAVVFFPVVAVTLGAIVLNAADLDLAFFLFVALATVSIEICIGILINKAMEVRDLDRQECQMRILHKNATEDIRRFFFPNDTTFQQWMSYFSKRRSDLCTTLAKASLVTAISMIFYCAIVMVEVYRMKQAVAIESAVQSKINVAENKNDGQATKETKAEEEAELKLKEAMESVKKDRRPLAWVGGGSCTFMLFLAFKKLWASTRSSYAFYDATSVYATPEEALEAYACNPHFHLSEHEELRNMRFRTLDAEDDLGDSNEIESQASETYDREEAREIDGSSGTKSDV